MEGLPGSAAPGDHLQTVWQLWLPGHQLGRGAAPWLDPYSFQPEVEPRINFAGWPFGVVFGPLKGLFGAVVAWNLFVLLGYLGAGGLTFLWLRSVGLGVGASLVGGLVFALAPYRAVQGGAGHLLAWIGMLLPLSLWAWERRLYWLTAAALASIPLSGQVHLALGALPFVFVYALVRGGDRRWAGGAARGRHRRRCPRVGAVDPRLDRVLALVRPGRALLGRPRGFRLPGSAPRPRVVRLRRLARPAPGARRACAPSDEDDRSSRLFRLSSSVCSRWEPTSPGTRRRGRRCRVWERPGCPGRLMPIACLAIAGLAAFGLAELARHMEHKALGAAAVAALALVAIDLRAGVTAYRPTAADEGNRAYAALRREEGGRLLEMPVHAPDRQEASVYLYYAMQAPRERPAGYSTVAPTEAARVLRELQPCADVRHLAELGVRYLAVHGRPQCGVAGRLLARDGPVALYEAYIPVAW